MDDAFLADLRCPFDPEREATFARENQAMVCTECGASFPIRNGLPILIPDEADLPPGVTNPAKLHQAKA
jgi:uncharacterized protein YbaR (Trm112 family)